MISALSLLSLVFSVVSDGEETESWEEIFERADALRAQYGVPPIPPSERMKILIGKSTLSFSESEFERANLLREKIGIPQIVKNEGASLLTRTHLFPPEWMVGFLDEETRKASGIRRKKGGPLDRDRYGRYVGIYRLKPGPEPDRPFYDLVSFLSMKDPFFSKEIRKMENHQIVEVASKMLLVPSYYYMWLIFQYPGCGRAFHPLEEHLVVWPWE
jgi:hypothetical protein